MGIIHIDMITETFKKDDNTELHLTLHVIEISFSLR